MAISFIDRVNNLTSLSAPGGTDIDQFLTDGAADIINKIVVIKPPLAMSFSKETIGGVSGADVGNAPIIEATFGYASGFWEDYDNTYWGDDIEWTAANYPCTRISQGEATMATDPSSLYYRSKYNAGYYLKNGKAFSVPASNGDQNLNVIHVHYPTITNGENPTSDSLQYFAQQFIYLIPIYAAMKLLNKTLSAIDIDVMGEDEGTPSKVFDDFLQTDEDSELAGIQAQRLQQEISAKNAEYQWMVEQYTRLKAEYNEAFAVLRPPKATA